MHISKVSLEDMLRRREERALRQRKLIERYALPVVCFTMNIPGYTKHTPLIELAFREGLGRLEASLPEAKARELLCAPTGCEAFFVFDADAKLLKQAAVAVEEGSAVGRLYDIDVLDASGEKLSRKEGRSCVVCGGPVSACARSRAHGLNEVSARVDALLSGFAAQKFAQSARDALIVEVDATPKPGLVDRNNCGAHRDMNIESFYASAAAILPHFEQMVRIALDCFDVAPASLMAKLRAEGIAAENAMREATGGANAHKGAIFSMGLLLAGAAIYLRTGKPALAEAARLASLGLWDALEAAARAPATHGDRVYARTGATGARGEAGAGFPAARNAKAALEGFLAQGYAPEEAAALTLPIIMAKLDDTNVLHRGGEEGLAYAQISAARVNALPVGERLKALHTLDEAFICRNLSPGGCADVLSLALLMKAIGDFVEL